MKNIKFITTVLAMTFLLGEFTFAKTQTGNVRIFDSFDGISLLGSGNVEIIHGNKNEVIIHAPNDLIPYIITEVKNGTLKIGKRKKGWKKFKFFHEEISYKITVKDIDHLKISGSGDIYADELNGSKCRVVISGSGEIDVEKIDAGILDVVLSGSGDVDIESIRAKNIDVGISGSGDASFGCSDKLEAHLTGSGDVVCYGNPSVRSHSTGSGSIITQ